MRSDILQDRKCVHIMIDKGVHAALRTKVFHHNLSIQELFDEFAKLVVSDEPKAKKIVEQLIMRKASLAIEGKSLKRKKRNKHIGELDAETLYSLIEKGTEPHEVV